MVQEFPMVRVRRNLAYSLFQLHLCFSQLRRRRFMGWIDANLRRSKRDAKALLLVWSSLSRDCEFEINDADLQVLANDECIQRERPSLLDKRFFLFLVTYSFGSRSCLYFRRARLFISRGIFTGERPYLCDWFPDVLSRTYCTSR